MSPLAKHAHQGSVVSTQDILRVIDEGDFEFEFEYLGVRTQYEPFTLGPIDHESHVWIDGEDTGEVLDGISVTSVRSPEIAMHANDESSSEARRAKGSYAGFYTAVIGGNKASSGDDPGELVISDPTVLYVFKKKR